MPPDQPDVIVWLHHVQRATPENNFWTLKLDRRSLLNHCYSMCFERRAVHVRLDTRWGELPYHAPEVPEGIWQVGHIVHVGQL